MGSKFISCRLPEDLYDEFSARCADEGVTVSQQVRLFIDEFLYPSTKDQAAAPAETPAPAESDPDRLAAIESTLADLSRLLRHVADQLKEQNGRLEYVEELVSDDRQLDLGSSVTEDRAKGSAEGSLSAVRQDQADGNHEAQAAGESEPGEPDEEDNTRFDIERPFDLLFKKPASGDRIA